MRRNSIYSFQQNIFNPTGQMIGVVVGFFISGILAKELNWEWVFYVPAIIIIIWSILWHFLVFNSPGECKYISKVTETFKRYT